jgi:hypothetical protein
MGPVHERRLAGELDAVHDAGGVVFAVVLLAISVRRFSKTIE